MHIRSRPTKPSAIRLHSSRLRLILSLLKCSSLDDLSIFVSHSFAAVEHLEAANLFGIAVEVLALDLLQTVPLELVSLVGRRGESHRAYMVGARVGRGGMSARLPNAGGEVKTRRGVWSPIPIQDQLRRDKQNKGETVD